MHHIQKSVWTMTLAICPIHAYEMQPVSFWTLFRLQGVCMYKCVPLNCLLPSDHFFGCVCASNNLFNGKKLFFKKFPWNNWNCRSSNETQILNFVYAKIWNKIWFRMLHRVIHRSSEWNRKRERARDWVKWRWSRSIISSADERFTSNAPFMDTHF